MIQNICLHLPATTDKSYYYYSLDHTLLIFMYNSFLKVNNQTYVYNLCIVISLMNSLNAISLKPLIKKQQRISYKTRQSFNDQTNVYVYIRTFYQLHVSNEYIMTIIKKNTYHVVCVCPDKLLYVCIILYYLIWLYNRDRVHRLPSPHIHSVNCRLLLPFVYSARHSNAVC